MTEIMVNKEKKISKREVMLVVIAYSLFITVFFFLLKLIGCGYHLVDDHEMIQYTLLKNLYNNGFFQMVVEIVKYDLGRGRFRLIFEIGRAIVALTFGPNLISYTIIKIIETIICFCLLHFVCRQFGSTTIISACFTIISMVGYQACNWWKLGTCEIQGTVWFLLGFLFLQKYINNNRTEHLIISVLSTALMSGCKENFFLLIPFMVAYFLYKKCGLTVKGSIDCIKNDKKIFLYIIILLVHIVGILFFSHAKKYSGFNSDELNVDAIIRTWKIALGTDLKWFFRFGILFTAILLTFWDKLKIAWKEITLVAIFVIPQAAIYIITGITERYILPFSIGYALLFVVIPFNNILHGKRKKIYIIGLLLLMAAHLRAAAYEANYFRYRGNSVQNMLNTVKDISDNNDKVTVLSCLHPNEEGDRTIYFWQEYYGHDNVYVWYEDENRIIEGKINDLHNFYEYYPERWTRIEDMDVIVMYNHEDRHYFYTPSINLEGYDYIKSGTLDIYVKNGLVDTNKYQKEIKQ